jgi:Transposase DDE domain
MPARSTTKQFVYRVRNWKQDNDALVRRGSLTPWVEQETLEAWRYQGPTRQGAQFEYSDLAIECLLTLRAVYHLTLRVTEGFARSLFELMDLDLPVPDSSTLGRRAATARITLPKKTSRPLHLVLDSTGLSDQKRFPGPEALLRSRLSYRLPCFVPMSLSWIETRVADAG